MDTALNERALQKFVAYGYIPAPLTLYRSCSKLPGGCQMTVELDGGEPRVVRYWKFALEPDAAMRDEREEHLVDELQSLLMQAVKRRLISDVPLGVFLSGGVDSSAIAAAAVAHRPRWHGGNLYRRIHRSVLR